MQKRAIIRIAAAELICFLLLLYNICAPLRPAFKVMKVDEEGFHPVFFPDSLEEKEESQKEEKEDEKEPQAQENASSEGEGDSVAAQTGAIKGKIISQYISPYQAKTSYNGVYMKNNTSAAVDIKALLGKTYIGKLQKNGEPQVLIMHTHTTETYMGQDSEYYTEEYTSRSTDNTKNMVAVGNKIAEKLNSAGWTTLHATHQHDYPQYNGSYGRSAATVKEYLEKYPSIKIVLDIHRDAVSAGGQDKVKLVTEIGGKKAAQVMLVMGSQTGSVTGHPKWQENLSLALRLQQMIEVKYPTLARPLSLVSSKYNQNLTNGSILIEIGTDANTLSEACYSAELVGEAIAALLNSME